MNSLPRSRAVRSHPGTPVRRLVSAGTVALVGLAMTGLHVATAPSALATTTFTYTGAPQSYRVPSGTTAVVVEAWGASGGGGSAGRGGYVRTTVPVTAGETLAVHVGGQGQLDAGGWNGGGNRGGGSWTIPTGGGGATDVRRAGSRIVVAGGGGGMAHSVGGDGGYPAGTAGTDNGNNSSQRGGAGGRGGTTFGGGAGGYGYCGSGFAGSFGAGGNGGYTSGFAGGGGGGGYYGGGGGGSGCYWGGAAGGGGSSWVTSGASATTYATGVRVGDGMVVITPAEAGNVSVDPVAQARTVGQTATIRVTVTDAGGAVVPGAPVVVSRTGANPQSAQTFYANSSGAYTYSYTGGNGGVDVVQVANAAGAIAEATVEWLPSTVGSAYPSDDCTSGNVVSGYVGANYLRVRTQASGGQQWVCFVAQGGGVHEGGRVVVSGSLTPNVGVDTDQTSAESCLALGRRLHRASVANGTELYAYVVPNPNGAHGAWVCLRLGGVFLRLRLAATGPVVVGFVPDATAAKAYSEQTLTGLYSRTCQASGGTRLLNLAVGGADTPVALYTWDQADGFGGPKRHVCVRAGAEGGRLTVDADAVPGVQLGGSRDASCSWELYSDDMVSAYTVNPFSPTFPAGVCVTTLGFTERVTVTNSSGGTPVSVALD